MEQLTPMVQAFLALGPTVILPVFIFFIGLLFRVKPAESFRSGLTIGVGFVGINLVVALLVDNLGPAAQAMVANFGIQLTQSMSVGRDRQVLLGHRRSPLRFSRSAC